MTTNNVEYGAPDQTPDRTAGLSNPWFAWNNMLAEQFKLPFAGDVTQWIKAWGQAVGQIGFLNVNLGNSADPSVEKEISGKYSYGRQLGRILDVLAPLVNENGARLCENGSLDERDLDDFQTMVGDIKIVKMAKRPSVEAILLAIERLRRDFPETKRQDFDAIVGQLKALRA